MSHELVGSDKPGDYGHGAKLLAATDEVEALFLEGAADAE
jgi:hypothetical protein